MLSNEPDTETSMTARPFYKRELLLCLRKREEVGGKNWIKNKYFITVLCLGWRVVGVASRVAKV